MKILYLLNSDIASIAANMMQAISMCNALFESNIDVSIVLNSTNNISRQDVFEIIETRYGIKPRFDFVLNTSLCARYFRLGKYLNGRY